MESDSASARHLVARFCCRFRSSLGLFVPAQRETVSRLSSLRVGLLIEFGAAKLASVCLVLAANKKRIRVRNLDVVFCLRVCKCLAEKCAQQSRVKSHSNRDVSI